MYSGDHALVHLSLGEQQDPHTDSGYFDHVAFRHQGLKSFLEKLQAAGIGHSSNFVSEHKMTQIFLKSPAGIGVEINFIDEQA